MPYNNNNYARYKETKNDIDLASNDVIIRKWKGCNYLINYKKELDIKNEHPTHKNKNI